MTATQRLLDALSEARLWQRHAEMGAIGATARGGVDRQALTPADAAAQTTLAAWAAARGFECSRDEIGNVYVRRAGTDPAADPVLMGSHLDTQPTGGRFDGAYGVLAGFEILEALADAAIPTRRPVEVVAWTNEEGSRFQPGAMGSGVFAGAFDLAAMLAVKDWEGNVYGPALERLRVASPLPARAMRSVRPAAYLEAHIEQGPVLEDAGATIGVVTGIQGSRRYAIDLTGEDAHAGTTPRARRRDALSAAVAAIAALEREMHDAADTVRFTVGRMEVAPNSPNTVPGKVLFTIDLRHPDAATLDRLGARIAPIVETIAQARGCGVEVRPLSHVAPTHFAAEMVAHVRAATRALGYRHLEMPSGAGHDAMYLSRLCPTAMVFVPCLNGVSHNEAESATPADLHAGARVMAHALLAVAAG